MASRPIRRPPRPAHCLRTRSSPGAPRFQQRGARLQRGAGRRLLLAQRLGRRHFRATLEPSKRYRLTVAGHAASGAATFRLTRGDSAPEWLSAPDGARETLLIGVAKVEALIYSDSGFSYRLDRLSLEECASCRTEQERADVATAVAPGWAAALYREPSLRVDGDGALAIGGDGGPAGIELRRDGLDPGRAYRVTIAGRGGFGAGMLRIDRDDARSQWIAAPEGVLPLTVSGASWIRLAFYGDAAFDYRLRAVAIETCADCETDSDLKRAIAQALPGIEAEASANPLHAAARLLDWAANDVELGGRIGRFEVLSAALPAMSAGQIHAELWAAHAGGASCGAFAVYYKKVLGLLGIPAFTINMRQCRSVDPCHHGAADRHAERPALLPLRPHPERRLSPRGRRLCARLTCWAGSIGASASRSSRSAGR